MRRTVCWPPTSATSETTTEAPSLANSWARSSYTRGTACHQRHLAAKPLLCHSHTPSFFKRALSARARATPFSSHPLPERWLSREVPTVDHDDCSNNDPQRGGKYEVIGQEGHPCYHRREDNHAGCETHVHEHRHEQTLTGTLVDPHHKHPKGRQSRYSKEELKR